MQVLSYGICGGVNLLYVLNHELEYNFFWTYTQVSKVKHIVKNDTSNIIVTMGFTAIKTFSTVTTLFCILRWGDNNGISSYYVMSLHYILYEARRRPRL